MDKKQVQAAIGRVDSAVAQLNMNREAHVLLVNDIQLIQQCCMKQFEEPEDGGTDEQSDSPEPCDEDSQGGGDSV